MKKILASDKGICNKISIERRTAMSIGTTPMKNTTLNLLAAVLVAGGFCGYAKADLVTPTNVIASTEDDPAKFPDDKLIDNSGLSVADLTGTHAANSSGSPNAWISKVGVALPQTVRFDLGGAYVLTDAHIWQYLLAGDSGNINQSDAIEISFSMSGTGGQFSATTNINLAAVASAPVSQQAFPLGGVTANAVRFKITSIHGGAVAGLSEVKFSGAVAKDLITPTGVIASSENEPAKFPDDKLIDNSGLTEANLLGTHAANSSGSPNAWISKVGVALPQTVTFDLGRKYVLSDAHIWQYRVRGVYGNIINQSDAIAISFSTSGTGGPFSATTNINLAAVASAPISQQTFPLGGVTANAVRFEITSIHGGSVAGLSEVKFSGTEVPILQGTVILVL